MANFNFNKVMIGGRLTEDPELRATATGISSTSFSVAVTRRFASGENGESGEKATDFLSCVAWRTKAEGICKYFHKGSSIFISGALQVRKYTDKNGNNRTATEILVDDFYFVDSKKDSSPDNSAEANSMNTPYTQAVASQAGTPEQVEFDYLSKDEELPF